MPTRSNGIRRESEEQGSILRPALFALTLLLVWVGVSPFPSLSDPTRIQGWEQGNSLNQIAFIALGTAVVLTAFNVDRRIFTVFCRPIYWLCLGWMALTVVTSNDPSLGTRRLLFTVIVIVIAGLVLILPRSERQFTGLVAFIPDRAVHQATDTFMRNDGSALLTLNLVGDWRGIFAHKNTAAAMMVLFIFIGLYVAQVRERLLGWMIVLAALVFLVFTRGKTAMILLPAILVLSGILRRAGGIWTRGFVALGGIAALSLIALGSAYSDAIRSVAATFLPDVTFTDRSDIWQLAIDNIAAKPLIGHGFETFWGSNALIYGDDSFTPGNATWAPDAHNAFLDLTLGGGFPGLTLACAWVLFTPLLDIQKLATTNPNPHLSTLFLRIWLFGLYASCFESTLFATKDPVWFTMLVAMFGLRLMTMCRVSAGKPDLAKGTRGVRVSARPYQQIA
jgi:O-antigen ligase